MENQLKQNLFALAQAYSGALDLALSTIGKRVVKDPRFFERIGSGKSFTIKTYDNAVEWFAAHWPENCAWPETCPWPERVPRPPLKEGAE
jgi:hypothetical protein